MWSDYEKLINENVLGFDSVHFLSHGSFQTDRLFSIVCIIDITAQSSFAEQGMVKEHYVPRSYLRQFTPENEGLISRYSLVEQHDGGDYYPPKDRYSINKAAASEGFADGWFENDETAHAENEMIEALRKIIACEPLLPDDVGRLSQFIAFQHSRTPQSKLHFDARQRLEDLVEGKPERVPEHYEDDWLDTLYYNANEGHETLQYMGWRIVENSTDTPFITSDKPVIHYFEQDFEEVTSTNQDLHGREIFCPLDPDHLLLVLDPEVFHVDQQFPNTEIERVTISERSEVHKLNMLQGVSAFQEVFGPVGYGDLLERTIQALCDAFPHEDFIRGNRSDLETMETAMEFGSGMATMEDVGVYLEKYKPLIDSRRLKSHAIWAFSHNISIVEELRRDDPREGYWGSLTVD